MSQAEGAYPATLGASSLGSSLHLGLRTLAELEQLRLSTRQMLAPLRLLATLWVLAMWRLLAT